MPTWDETAPAGSSARSSGDDAIRQFKVDIRERLAAEHVNGDGAAMSASAFTEARHKLSSIGLLGLLKGLRIEQRSYATSGNITISGKLQIEINGDMCYLNSDTNLAFSGLTASTSYYIYAASPGHEVELTAGNFSYSTTAPTYSTAKKGWYNGTSRAIGFFRTASSGVYMFPFVQVGSLYTYQLNSQISVLSSGASSSYVEVTGVANYIPVFYGLNVTLSYTCSKTGSNRINFFLSHENSGGGAGSVEITSDIGGATSVILVGNALCPLNTSRTVYYKVGMGSLTLYVVGFDLDGSL